MKILTKTILMFAVLATFTIKTAFAHEIKFIQVTDSHFSTISESYSDEDIGTSQRILTNTIKDINKVPDVDFVVFTGDNIDKANCDDLKKFIKIANGLKAPYYMVIGNHEVFKSQNLDKKEYMKIVRKNTKSDSCKPRKANYVFKKKGVVFLVVDGAKEIIPGPAGYFKKDTLKWLDKELTNYKNDDVVIFQHFPIVAPCYNRTHTTYNVQAYNDVLAKHKNVIAIFSGHYHTNGEQMVDGIYHVSTPALIVPPHDYKVVEIEMKNKKDYKIYTMLRHAEQN